MSVRHYRGPDGKRITPDGRRPLWIVVSGFLESQLRQLRYQLRWWAR